jgi:hypothetical protein
VQITDALANLIQQMRGLQGRRCGDFGGFLMPVHTSSL